MSAPSQKPSRRTVLQFLAGSALVMVFTAGQTITLTYTAAPRWLWFGE
jgi:hypothetical protein